MHEEHITKMTRESKEMLRKEHWMKAITQNSTNGSSVQKCHNEQRVSVVEDYCHTHYGMKEAKMPLRKLAQGLLVDDVHKVLMCTHAKVGSSTWKSILADNIKPLEEVKMNSPMHGNVHKFGIWQLSDIRYSDEDIQQRLNTYYKVMVVRHPYDRLQSCYFDKIAQKIKGFLPTIHNIIAKLYPNASEKITKDGNITFSDFVRWIQLGHNDKHWQGPYHKRCFPCLVHYDYYVKLETQDRDASFIVNNILSGRPGQKLKHHFQPTMSTVGFSSYMYVMENLSDQQLQFLRKRLQPDLDMFGYTFAEKTLIGKCGNEQQCC